MAAHSTRWLKFLQKIYGDPVRYTEKRVPINFKTDASFGRPLWRLHKENREWFYCNRFFIGLDKFIKPSHFTIVFNVGPVYISVFSSRGAWGESSEFANIEELRTFLKAIADPTLLPLCISYPWAAPIIEAYYRDGSGKVQ